MPAVVFNSITPLHGAEVFAYVGYDQLEAGRKVARYLKAIARGPLRVCIIEGLPSQFTKEREGGFLDELKSSPEISVVRTVRGDWDRAIAFDAAAGALWEIPTSTSSTGFRTKWLSARSMKSRSRDDGT